MGKGEEGRGGWERSERMMEQWRSGGWEEEEEDREGKKVASVASNSSKTRLGFEREWLGR